MDRREAALEQRAPLRELALLVDGNALRRIVRMRHDDVGDPRGELAEVGEPVRGDEAHLHGALLGDVLEP